MLSEHRYQARRAILRGGASESSTPAEIYVCSNHWCASRGAEAALASFVGLIPEEDPTEDVSRTVLVCDLCLFHPL
jgi:NADH:ubiquinone oxidoreductase subunit E